MANNKLYSNVTKFYPWPKDLRKNIQKLGRIKGGYGGLHSLEYADWFQMVDGLPMRRVFAYAYTRSYKTKEKPKLYIREVARYYNHHQFLSSCIYCLPMAGKRVEFFYGNGHKFTYWPEKNNSPSKFWNFWPTQSLQNKKDFLRENNFLYTGWNNTLEMEFDEYLTLYLENPKIELLSKANMGYWIKYLRYLDTSKKTLHEIFKINQECVHLLKVKDFDYEDLMIVRKTGMSDIEELRAYRGIQNQKRQYLRYHLYGQKPDPNVLKVFDDNKTFRYLVKQLRHKNFHISDYMDYLNELVKLGAITDPKVLYPKSFKKAHSEASRKIKLAESQELLKGFEKSYKKHKKYSYENETYLIRPVKAPIELYDESTELDHCVRTYDKNVAAGTTEILFIRQIDCPDKPFFTLELKKKKVIQVRGKNNKNPNKEIQHFVDEWANKFKIQYTKEQPRYGYY